ncbi:NAD(P)/FAD-dependent oxidoreductase [Planctomicrobium piriforme]|uniref:Predicted NAD/FAD-binding protein n=1 Tax=Planctomicrobium piriforme TaxID=1576369 RepID=A0A1I3FB16_9PLAN|nr:FAD-dependent oxidoreductase [Planctomicrobium piriforme]SFI08340.1 Predicted NAD/FAD-binding protein [Planctomicrobium piriforme]
MRIAIIGGGISGLYAAEKLRARHQITLFEAPRTLGGHVNTVDVEIGGERHAVDTGFIVYNERTYPHFIRLLTDLGIESQPTSMSFSVRCDRSNLEYNGNTLNTLFAQRGNLLRPRFYRLLSEIVRFNRLAKEERGRQATGEAASTQTVGEFLAAHRFAENFSQWYLLPMGAAIWSCPQDKFAGFPIAFLVDFFFHHGLLDLVDRPVWRVIKGGSRTYVNRMLERFGSNVEVRAGTPIQSVSRTSAQVTVTPVGQPSELFDHVIFACHSDQALKLLADPTPTEKELLTAFPYQPNVATLHTDVSVLPRRKLAWASWNVFLPDQQAALPRVTYCMNILQGLKSRHVFNVSLNCDDAIDPAKVLARFQYAHPVFSEQSRAAQRRHAELINVNRTSYCGAYWRNGFHEDGVVSALAVCRGIEGASVGTLISQEVA